MDKFVSTMLLLCLALIMQQAGKKFVLFYHILEIKCSKQVSGQNVSGKKPYPIPATMSPFPSGCDRRNIASHLTQNYLNVVKYDMA